MYKALGFGLYPARAKLTLQNINQVPPALARFACKSEENKKFESILLKAIAREDSTEAANLSKLFKRYNSDKSTDHKY